MLLNNDALMELLRESMIRKYVQTGIVVDIKPVMLKGVQDSVIVINFNGYSVYCSRDEFTSRKNISTFTGFIGTPVPFVVMDMDRDQGVVVVSRMKALPLVQSRFIRNVREGDMVRGTVTGIVNDSKLVFVEVQGYPCLVPPGEWDLNSITDLREVVQIGGEVELRVLSITKLAEDANFQDSDSDFDYRIRVSRKALQKDAKKSKWEHIEQFHSEHDHVLAKVVAKMNGSANSYLIELASSGIVLMGNLQYPLNQQFKYGLPLGVKVQAQIISLNKSIQQGRARIYRIDPTLQTAGAFKNGF